MKKSLAGKVALVAGATRGAGRGIAVQLGAAGATVYATGRTTRDQRSEMNRPETIEETAALVTEAGGRGIAIQVDHLVPDEVRALVARIRDEQGGLHVLVNDIWGATKMEWNKSVWESDLEYGLCTLRLAVDTHAITSHFAIPLTPAFVGRAVVALAADPDVSRWNGKSLSSGQLAKIYGFTDVDGSQPDAWRYVIEVQDAGKPADVTGYR
jgi:short chain dehydrogenase